MKSRVRAILKRGNELLLVKHKNPQGVPYNTWVLPGGGIEDGELITAAIHREMVEETGLEPVIGRLLYVHQFINDGKAEGPEFFFHVENADDYTSVDLAKTTHGELEIAEIGFHDPRTLENVLPEFLVDLADNELPAQTELVIRDQGLGY